MTYGKMVGMQEYPGGWFGRSWGAPVCEPERHRETPIGDQCEECGQQIKEDDKGMLIPFIRDIDSGRADIRPWHLDCFLRNVMGPGADFLDFSA